MRQSDKKSAGPSLLGAVAILDPGVSREYLVSLGTSADSFLIPTLDDPKYKQYLHAMVSWLGWAQTGEPRVSTDVYRALVRFVNANISYEGEVPFELIHALETALWNIGERGGLPGVAYLTDWVTTDKYMKQVRCFSIPTGPGYAADLLRRSAITGLGLSGSPQALEVLKELAKNPPKSMYPGSFAGCVQDAIGYNSAIQRDGDEMFFFKKHLQSK